MTRHEPTQEELDVLYWSHQLLRYIAQSDDAALGMITAKRRLKEARARLRARRQASGVSSQEPVRIHEKWRKEEAS